MNDNHLDPPEEKKAADPGKFPSLNFLERKEWGKWEEIIQAIADKKEAKYDSETD